MRTPRSAGSIIVVATFVVGSALALTGCSALDVWNGPAPTATAMSTAAAESSQTPTPQLPSSTPTAVPAQFLPVGLGCAQLLPDSFVFEISPNFARQGDYTPDSGSTSGFIAANQGVACRIMSLSGGDHIDVAVASMDAKGMTELSDKFSSTQSRINDFGGNVQGFFTNAGGVGETNALSSKYWVVVSSPLFTQSQDAVPIVEQVLSALG